MKHTFFVPKILVLFKNRRLDEHQKRLGSAQKRSVGLVETNNFTPYLDTRTYASACVYSLKKINLYKEKSVQIFAQPKNQHSVLDT